MHGASAVGTRKKLRTRTPRNSADSLQPAGRRHATSLPAEMHRPSGKAALTDAAVLLVLLFLLGSAQQSTARSHYANLIPNGYNVRDESGRRCFGVGHISCSGGGTLNPFGKDLREAGFRWTQDLCNKDSDGDGLSNGVELGDPCCEWAADSNEVPAVTDAEQLGHPGLATSLPASLADVGCGKQEGLQGKKQDATLSVGKPNPMFFNQGERQQQFVLLVDTEIPDYQDTTYLNVPFNLDFLHRPVHAVGFFAAIDNKVHMHHFLVYACTETFTPEEVGIGLDAFQNPNWDGEHGCYDVVYGWAPGQNRWELPKDVGMLIGPGTSYPAMYIQLHYDNPELVKGQVDRSSVQVNFTPDLRQHNMGVLWLGNPLIHEREIPKGSSSWGMTQRCKLTLEEDVADEIHVFLHAPHMHIAGRRIWSETVGVNVGTALEELASGDQPLVRLPGDHQYDFRNQLVYPTNFRLRNNDLITTTCVYDVMGREGQVAGGLGSYDEMCINFMMYYPAEALPVKVCRGDEGDDRPPFFGPWDPSKKSVMEVPELAHSILTPNRTLVHGYPHFTYRSPINDVPATKFAIDDSVLDMPGQAARVDKHSAEPRG